ncbi:MAG TPA: adenosine deaminase [Candidatus Eisenbacteria bacterium]|nr:adenosine deaminase [Candidatus Eisenbacteria bacterium]
MPDLATERDITTIPKVELHIHLNGSITEATASILARRHGAADPDEALRLVDGRYPGHYANFDGFLDAYMAANAFVRTADDLELVAAEFARQQAAQGIVYSEAIFTAGIQVRNGMEPAAMWRALRSGLAAAGPGTRIGLVVDAIRDLGRADAEETIRLVEDADAPIVGLCLTGADSTDSIEAFTILRDASTRLGMGLEVHCGEMQPPSSIVDAIDVLHADRIGHGVTAIEDPALLERLVREQVPLDVCPSSNVGLSLFPSLEAHPFTAFWRAGVNMTISSDDPPFVRTTLTDELRHVVRLAGLARGDLEELQRRAVRNSFAAPDVKAEIHSEIDAWAAGG